MKASITFIPNFVLLLAVSVAMVMNKLGPSSVSQELANLCKDPASRCIAMAALTKHIEQLEAKFLPRFLRQLLEFARKSNGSHIHAITLCELAARKHGTDLVYHVSIIMATLTVALNSSTVNSNIALRQACAKLVRSISNYIIYPTSLASLREQIFRDLCNRVGEAPGCLHALVESQSWKFAPEEVINGVCLQATTTLMQAKGSSKAIAHMQLICSLVKANCAINLQPYSRVLLKTGVEIFETATNWQQRLNAVQMINSFLKSMEAMTFCMELPNILKVLANHRNDKIYSLRKAVAEAIRRANLILSSVKSIKYSAINHPALIPKKSMGVDDFLVLTTKQRNDHMQYLRDGNVYSSMDQFVNFVRHEELIMHEEGFDSQNSRMAEWRVRYNPIADHKFPSGESNGRMIVGLKEGIFIDQVELPCANHGSFDIRVNTHQQEICSAASSNIEGSENVSLASSSHIFKLPNAEKWKKPPSNRQAEKTQELQEIMTSDCAGLEQEAAGSTLALELQEDKGSVCSKRRINLPMLSGSWKKARESIGLVLRASLCAALIIPAAIASSKFLKLHEECHIFAPKMQARLEKCYTKSFCRTVHPAT